MLGTGYESTAFYRSPQALAGHLGMGNPMMALLLIKQQQEAARKKKLAAEKKKREDEARRKAEEERKRQLEEEHLALLRKQQEANIRAAAEIGLTQGAAATQQKGDGKILGMNKGTLAIVGVAAAAGGYLLLSGGGS